MTKLQEVKEFAEVAKEKSKKLSKEFTVVQNLLEKIADEQKELQYEWWSQIDELEGDEWEEAYKLQPFDQWLTLSYSY